MHCHAVVGGAPSGLLNAQNALSRAMNRNQVGNRNEHRKHRHSRLNVGQFRITKCCSSIPHLTIDAVVPKQQVDAECNDTQTQKRPNALLLGGV